MTSLAGDFWVISLYSSISIILQIECICIVCQMYENSKKNRFVIATQDIRAGELLLSESPVVCGPYWDTKISCLNCYAPPGPMCKWTNMLIQQYNVDGKFSNKKKHNEPFSSFSLVLFSDFKFLESVKWCHCVGIAVIIMMQSNVKLLKSFNCPPHFSSIISMWWHHCVFYFYSIDMRNKPTNPPLIPISNIKSMKYWVWNHIVINVKIHRFG